jgi:hypothetical protein
METQTNNLKKFYYANEGLYVYAYDEATAIKALVDEFGDCDFELEYEGETSFGTIDDFDSKYTLVAKDDSNEEDCLSYFYDKWDDWNLIVEREKSHPGTVWSDFDSGEKVCGIYQIDVIGYFITTTPGVNGETYGHFDGEIC